MAQLPRVSYSSVVEHPKYSLEGRSFDSCSEHLDFLFLSMPVSLTEKQSFTLFLFFVACFLSLEHPL